MGNLLTKLYDRIRGHKHRPDKPDNEVQQPYLFGLLPEPYPIKTINPELMVYPGNDPEQYYTVNSSHTPAEAVRYLKSNGCLINSIRLVIVAHGFRDTKNTTWLHKMKDTIFAEDNKPHERQDVAILGWGDGADIGFLRYPQAASNSLRTGEWLGELLIAIREDRSLDHLQTYAIGHSLGAHLVGRAGRSRPGILNRITGLDPAGVGFQLQNINKRLCPTDAEMVDVIHTDGLAVPYFGTLIPLGTVDFYPNFGWNQPKFDRIFNQKPSFDETNNGEKKRARPSPYGGNISEGHGRAIAYFIWSIENRGSFCTSLQLEKRPDAEKAVHRIVAKRDDDVDGGVSEAEMGYWCDRPKLHHQCKVNNSTISTQSPNSQVNIDIAQNSKRYIKPKGYYYIHTNGSEPWL